MKSAQGVFLRRFGRIVAAIIFLAIALGALAGMGTWVFTIKTVEVVGEGIRVTIDEKRITKNLLFFPADALRTQLLREYPILDDVVVQKKFPHTLIVVAHRREPIVRIAAGERNYLVAKGGVVLGHAVGTESLPTGYFSVRSYAAGETIEEKEANAFIVFTQHLTDTSLVHSATPRDSASIRLTMGTTDIFIPHEGDLGEKASTLQTLIAGFRIKGTLPTVIDLRFEKPIVTF